MAGDRHGLAGADGKCDVALFRAFVFSGLQRFDIRQNSFDPRLQLRERCFGIGHHRQFGLRKTRAGLARKIASKLNLFRQRIHGRMQPRFKQFAWRDVVCGGVSLGFGENRGQRIQCADKDRS